MAEQTTITFWPLIILICLGIINHPTSVSSTNVTTSTKWPEGFPQIDLPHPKVEYEDVPPFRIKNLDKIPDYWPPPNVTINRNATHGSHYNSQATTSSTTEGTSNDSIATILLGPTEKHTATILFLYGHGDSEHKWPEIFVNFAKPWVKGIFPLKIAIPFLFNNGDDFPLWYYNKNISENNLTRCPAVVDMEGLGNATAQLHKIIQGEIDRGIPAKRIIIGGFSQGGALAYHAGLTFNQKLGGIMVSSTWLPMYKHIYEHPNLVCHEMPILHLHGVDDPYTCSELAYFCAKILKNRFTEHLIFKAFPKLKHEVNAEGIEMLKNFTYHHLPRTE